MATLTKEHFDKHLTKIDKNFEQVNVKFAKIDKNFEQVNVKFAKIDKKLNNLDVKFNNLEVNLDKKIDDKIDELGVMISRGFEDVIKRLDVRERVEKLEKKMDKVTEALNI